MIVVSRVSSGALGLIILGALACGSVSATQNINAKLLSKSVVYLYRGDEKGEVYADQLLGTGFLVSVPLVSDPKHAYLLLVTARHVIDPAWNHCPDSQPATLYVRYNKKNYDPKSGESGVDYGKIPLTKGDVPTWIHPKESEADVAVMLLDGRTVDENADAVSIPISDFATDEEAQQKGSTDPIVSVGLLLSYPGVKRNYPVFKFGYISTKPDELVPSQCVKDGAPNLLRLWLLSINLLPGTSGSPIFFSPEGANGASLGGGRAMLMGLQSTSFSGADVSGMTPVQYIFEAIESLNLRGADLYRGLPQNKPSGTR